MSDKKYTSPEHAIRNLMELKSIGHNVPTANAFFKPIGVISPPKGDEHVDGSEKIRASRNIAKERQSETMREEDLAEGWYNPKTGKTYASKAESMAAAKEFDAAKASEINRLSSIASNQNATKPAATPAPAAPPKQANPKPVDAPVVAPPKPTAPVAAAPKAGAVKTGAKVAAGWGVVPAVMGAVQRGTEAYGQGKDGLEIGIETAKGGGEGLAAGLAYPAAAISNAGEGILKTIGAVKSDPDPEKNETLATKATKMTGGVIEDPAKTAKIDPRGSNVKDPYWKKLEKTFAGPEKTAMEFDKKHSKALSVGMAATSGLAAGLSAPWGAAEGGLAEFGKKGIDFKSDYGLKDIKRITKGALTGAANYWKGGAEYPYSVYKNVVGEEIDDAARARIIKQVIREAFKPKAEVKMPRLHPFDDPKLLKLFSHGAESSKSVDGYKIKEYEGQKYWINDKGDIASSDLEASLSKKAIDISNAESIGKGTGSVGSGVSPSKPETKVSPYQAKQAEKLKGKAAGTELSKLPKFETEPAKVKITAEPAPELPMAGKEPQLQKAPAEPAKAPSKPFADKPKPIEFSIAKEPAATPIAGAEPQLKVKQVDTTKPVEVTKTKITTEPLVKPAEVTKTKPVEVTKTKPAEVTKPLPKSKPVEKTKTPEKPPGKPPGKEKGGRRRLPFGLPGGTPGQPSGFHQDSNVPVDIYKHMPKEYMTYEETRYDIENVARPNNQNKNKTRSKQGEIIRKIIEEKKASKKNSTVIINPELKQQEPEQTK